MQGHFNTVWVYACIYILACIYISHLSFTVFIYGYKISAIVKVWINWQSTVFIFKLVSNGSWYQTEAVSVFVC